MKDRVAGETPRATGVQSLLKQADPLRDEPALSRADVEGMRQVVLSVERSPARVRSYWPSALAAAALVVLIAIGGVLIERTPRETQPPTGEKVATPSDAGERIQLQFATPGGTRIIWTLDPQFKLEGAAP